HGSVEQRNLLKRRLRLDGVYAECIKDCDKAFERDRKHRPGTEQLCGRWKKSRQVTAKNGWFCWLCCCSDTPSPLTCMCSLQSCDQSVGERGLIMKQRVCIGGKPVEGSVETELESSAMERRVCYLATKGSERMIFETCPSKNI
ncbi:hypothetical protein IGI04_030516, partial [Brassica rapa subsp. trilocularis]